MDEGNTMGIMTWDEETDKEDKEDGVRIAETDQKKKKKKKKAQRR